MTYLLESSVPRAGPAPAPLYLLESSVPRAGPAAAPLYLLESSVPRAEPAPAPLPGYSLPQLAAQPPTRIDPQDLKFPFKYLCFLYYCPNLGYSINILSICHFFLSLVVVGQAGITGK